MRLQFRAGRALEQRAGTHLHPHLGGAPPDSTKRTPDLSVDGGHHVCPMCMDEATRKQTIPFVMCYTWTSIEMCAEMCTHVLR